MKEKEKQNEFPTFTDELIDLICKYLEKSFELFKEIKGDDE